MMIPFRPPWRRLALTALVIAAAVRAAEPATAPIKILLLPGDCFTVAGRPAFLISPRAATAAKSRP